MTGPITLLATSMLARAATVTPPAAGVAHTVAQGESIDSLAFKHGHAADTIWAHANNAALRELRGDARALQPGDAVYLPPLRRAQFSGEATGQRHVYVRQDVPSLLRFRPLVFGQPAPGVPYEVLQGERSFGKGMTTSDGDVEFEVRPDEDQVAVRVFFEHFTKDYAVQLRALDPIQETSGVQKRLAAMGFFQGTVDGAEGEALDDAVARFRMHYGLHQENGLDDKLRDAIHRQFGG
jgi:hypothetical protein